MVKTCAADTSEDGDSYYDSKMSATAAMQRAKLEPWEATDDAFPSALLPPLIDTSTPESLERDFYAWLWGVPKIYDGGSDEDSGCASFSTATSRSASSCSCASTAAASPAAAVYLRYAGGSDTTIRSSNKNYSSHNYWNFDEWQDAYSLPSLGSLFPNKDSDTFALESLNSINYHGGSYFKECEGKSTNTNNKKKVIKSYGRTNNNIKSDNNHGNRCSGTNQLGRTYSPGLPLSMRERERIVNLYRSGWKICDISKQLCVTHSCVSKILHRFRTTGTCRPKDAKEGRQESPLVEAIRNYRMRLGLTRQSEIREQLIRDGWCQRDSAPSRSSINHILRTKLDVRKRKK